MASLAPKPSFASNTLPPLTPETIQRAGEGLEASRHPALKRSYAQAFGQLQAIIDGKFEHRVSGKLRHWALRSLIHALFQVKVEYPDKIPQRQVILAANHLNHIDPFLLLSEVPASPYYYILGDARSLFNQSWKRLILGLSGGVIPLERRWSEETAIIEGANTQRRDLAPLAKAIEREIPSGGDIKTMRQIERAVQAILGRKDGIILFPEGRLGTTEGQLMLPFKRGTALYALRSGIPIVPVAIIGTKNLYFRKTLTLRFGEPLVFSQSQHPKRVEVEAVLEVLAQSLQALLPTDYQESDELKLFCNFLNQMFC